MKKLSTFLLVVAVVAISLVTSCKKEVYWTASTDDFEFDDPVVYQQIRHIEDTWTTGFMSLYKENTDAATKATQPYVPVDYDESLFYTEIHYRTFVPIIQDVESGGYFDLSIKKTSDDGFDDDKTIGNYYIANGGLWIEWKYENDLNPKDNKPDDNVKELRTKTDKDGKKIYEYDSIEDKYKEHKAVYSFEKPTASTITVTVLGVDSKDGTNRIEKEITVEYSEADPIVWEYWSW